MWKWKRMIRSYRNSRRNKERNIPTATTEILPTTTTTTTATTRISSTARAIVSTSASVDMHGSVSEADDTLPVREVGRAYETNESVQSKKNRHVYNSAMGSLVSVSIISYRLRIPEALLYAGGARCCMALYLFCRLNSVTSIAQHTLFVDLT